MDRKASGARSDGYAGGVGVDRKPLLDDRHDPPTRRRQRKGFHGDYRVSHPNSEGVI